MNNLLFAALLLVMMSLVYQLGVKRSRTLGRQLTEGRLHSRPVYHGMRLLLWTFLPLLIVYLLWNQLQPGIVHGHVLAGLPAELQPQTAQDQRILLQRLNNLASGFGLTNEAQSYELLAAEQLRRLNTLGSTLKWALMMSLAATSLVFAWRSIRPDLRARNQIESAVRWLLIGCSTVAILTTVGIVLSMAGEALRFFSFVNPVDFFLGTTWNPRFSTVGNDNQSGFGMLPLLWGTLMIALIALAVAIPIGLMAAIYMAEYASSRVRSFAKPIIEVLAGIPTIVYGFFALITVGPFLNEMGAFLGLEIRTTSALTAGVVMGIMLIPFISSLSDDIITQVPKSMREGSLGLGATKSETIRKVVLPAALPGVVGAILLAASRAIGETMIVVLAAGNSPILTANPFEAVSTMTVTIVNQLTGDLDFASPQSLVAFALGLTLFVITLLLNVIALVIVRKYREQYE